MFNDSVTIDDDDDDDDDARDDAGGGRGGDSGTSRIRALHCYKPPLDSADLMSLEDVTLLSWPRLEKLS